MPRHTVIVLANPAAKHLRELDRLPKETTIAVGKEPAAFQKVAAEADVILNTIGKQEPLRTVWSMAPRVQWVHSISAGLDGFLFPELVESNVPLTNSRGVYSRSLAEFAIASILYFAKDLPRMLQNKAARRWEQFDVEEVHGRTLAIIGYGDIGRVTAVRAQALGMKIIAVRRRPELSSEDSMLEAVYPMDQRKEAMSVADYVLVASPLTPETKGLVDEPELRAMKSSGVIINLGRGPVINESALIRILAEGVIRGAALDVFETEPLPESSPLWDMPNVLLSPHCADHTATWLIDAMALFIENFERFDRGEPLRNPVDKRAGY